jgi:hypothetical protein
VTPDNQTPPDRGRRTGFRPLTAVAAVLFLLMTMVPAAFANHGTRTLDVIPDVQEALVNTQAVLKAQLSVAADDVSGPINIDFELFSGPNDDDGESNNTPDTTCVINPGGDSCSIAYYGTGGTGTDRIRVWIDHDKANTFEGDDLEERNEDPDGGEPGIDDEPDITDVVEVVWNAGSIPVVNNLDCEPESAPQKPAAGSNSPQDFTCRASAPIPSGSPPGTIAAGVEGVHIDGENLNGPNDPDNTNGGTADYDDGCSTGADGSCVVHIVPTDGDNGTANVCFWADYPATSNVYDPAGINSDNGGGCDNEANAATDNDQTDVVAARWLAIQSLNLAPGTGSAATGSQAAPLTATLEISNADPTPVPGVPIIFSVSGANDVVDGAMTAADGTAGFTYTGVRTGSDTVTAFADLNDSSTREPFEPQATATRTWTPGNVTQLDCSPEASTRPVAPGPASQQTITCLVSDGFGNPVTAPTDIDAEFGGPNDPDDGALAGTVDVSPNFCTTAAGTGTCTGTVSATEVQAGTAVVCLWVDGNSDTAFDPAGAPTDGGECAAEGVAGPETNGTDGVLITWTPGAASKLDCAPELAASPPTGPGADQVITCAVRDANNNLVGPGTRIDGENLGGANDPDHSDGKGASGATNTTPDWDNFCTTTSDGTCTGVVPATGEMGLASLCFWVDTTSSADARFNISGAEADGGACDSDGVPPAADNENLTDILLKSWETRRPAGLVIPSTEATAAIGDGHALVTKATDQFGVGFADIVVKFSVTGVNTLSGSAKSNSDGEATLTYASKATGVDTITAYADFNNNGTKDEGEPSVTQTVTWVEPTPATGYWLVANDGGIFAYGSAEFFGSTGNIKLARPIVGMASTPTGKGYWLVASDGGIFAYGDAKFQGSTGNIKLAQPIVGMAATPSGNGYWLVAADGGIFAFGDAKFHGSAGGLKLAKPIVAMVPTSANGYWLVASDGGIFAFGDARFFGSTGNIKLAQPIVGMARTHTSDGYWMVAADGGIFAFGDAKFHGSAGGTKLAMPIVAVGTTLTGQGYWLVAADGGIFAYGDAQFYGSTGNIKLARPIVGMTARR